jgi:hypothetical protein
MLPEAPIEGRAFHTAVWTKEEMIVWGGSSRGKLFADGAALNTETFEWRPIAPAPLEARTGHTAVWTGEEMVIWGGCCERRGEEFGDGAAYNPANNTWRRLSPAPLHARTGHTGVKSGHDMMIWGGHVFERAFADGARYDPASDKWELLPPAPIEGRYSHTAPAAGRLLIWGGATAAPEILGDGAYYPGLDPLDWTPIRPTRPARSAHTAVWAPHDNVSEMIVWGGCCTSEGLELDGGAAYGLEAGSWRRLPPAALSPRQGHSATWTGRRMVIWGGANGLAESAVGLSDGAAYDPNRLRAFDRERDRWSPVPDSPLEGRYSHTAVITEDEIIIWGGCCADGGRAFSDGAGLDLARAGIPDLGSTEGIPIEGEYCQICPTLWALGLSFGLPILALLIWSVRRRLSERDR